MKHSMQLPTVQHRPVPPIRRFAPASLGSPRALLARLRRATMASASAALLGVLAAGCGTDFPNALVDCAGDEIHVEFLQKIVDDPDLTDGQKRAMLEDLCIVDEDIQDFILDNL